MHTFIDESGDTGPVGRGGKPYFRLAAVWVPSFAEAEAFREAVRQLRRDLGLRRNYEFKFANTPTYPERRRAFLSTALAQKFRFAACCIDKTDDYWKDTAGPEQHWACATSLAVQLRPIYHQAEEETGWPLREPVTVDNNSDSDFLNTIKRQFRGLASKSRPGSSLVGKVTFRDSQPDEMIQLVDMVVGAVGASIDSVDVIWYKLIADRSLGIIRLP